MSVPFCFGLRLLQSVFPLLLMLFFAGRADAYSCGDPSKNHCYGTTTWTQGTEYFGAYVDITQVQVACPSGCGGFIDDELWLIDTSSANCTTNQFGVCWVEAGTITPEGSNPTYFWADGRPGTGNTLNVHYLGGTDKAGTVNHYMIVKDGRVSPNTYLVFIYNDSQSTLYNGTSSVQGTGGCGSDLPQMAAHRIDIGQELAGSPTDPTKDASAGVANFTRNIWAVQALDAAYVFWYNAESVANTPRSDNPPTASWAQNPGSPGAPEGGNFTTRTP